VVEGNPSITAVDTFLENEKGNENESLLAVTFRVTLLPLPRGASLRTQTRGMDHPQETFLPEMGPSTELLVGGLHHPWVEMTVPGDKVVLHFCHCPTIFLKIRASKETTKRLDQRPGLSTVSREQKDHERYFSQESALKKSLERPTLSPSRQTFVPISSVLYLISRIYLNTSPRSLLCGVGLFIYEDDV
jgi:hypothetical protein